jgi:hypothetical protein
MTGCKRMDFIVMDQSAAGELDKKVAVDITNNEGQCHYKLYRVNENAFS